MNDLEWLARNLHKWESSHGDYLHFTRDNRNLCGFLTKQEVIERNVNLAEVYTYEQWQAERERLQNRPSWDDAPEWAEWLAQDGDGVWLWHELQAAYFLINGQVDAWLSRGLKKVAQNGEALCDWRETLEQRPPKNVTESALDNACDIIQECYDQLKQSNDHLDAAQDSLNIAREELSVGRRIAQAAIDRIDKVLKD